MYLIFAVHKLAKFSANPVKVHFEVLVHLLSCIRYNKTLVLNYYSDINDAPLSDLLRQAIIKTENPLMDFSDSSWQDCPDTYRIVYGTRFIYDYNIFILLLNSISLNYLYQV